MQQRRLSASLLRGHLGDAPFTPEEHAECDCASKRPCSVLFPPPKYISSAASTGSEKNQIVQYFLLSTTIRKDANCSHLKKCFPLYRFW